MRGWTRPGEGDVGEGDAHEGAREQAGVRDDQLGRLVDDRVVVQQEVDIDDAGSGRLSRRAHAAERALDVEAQIEEDAGGQVRLDACDRVQIRRLRIRRHRVGLVERRPRGDAHPGRRERVERPLDGRAAVAQVGAEAEVRGGHGRRENTAALDSPSRTM